MYKNCYSNPDHFGLTIVCEIDDPDACYSFEMIILWRDDAGRLFYACDEGCSCPSPFEMYQSVDSLNVLTDESWSEFEEMVNGWCSYEYRVSEKSAQVLAERTRMLRAAALALRGEFNG